jgi:hypothetical protein
MNRLRITFKWLIGLFLVSVIFLGLAECSLMRMEAAPVPALLAAAAPADTAQARLQLQTEAWRAENARINRNNYQKVLLSNDDWVWRSTAYPVAIERPLTRRILVMGDSFVWGDGYANINDTWWRQLQRELLWRGYREVEVIAAGMNGASTHAQLDIATKIIPRYRPDIVIWGYVTNDPDEGIVRQLNYGILNQDRVVRVHARLARHHVFPRLNFQLEQLRRTKLLKTLPQDELGYEYNEWELKILEPANLGLYRTTVNRLGDTMRSLGLPYFFVNLPNSTAGGFRPRYDAVIPLFTDAGVPFVDLFDLLVAEFGSLQTLPNQLGWGINPSNGHPGVISTRFYARLVADRLERDHAALLGPRGEPVTSGRPLVNDWMPVPLEVRRNDGARIEFTYPPESDDLLRMPAGQPYVQFSLALPASLGSIQVSGPNLASASLAVTRVDAATGVDYHKVEPQGEQAGSALVWPLADSAGRGINTVRLSAAFTGPDRTVTIEFTPEAIQP